MKTVIRVNDHLVVLVSQSKKLQVYAVQTLGMGLGAGESGVRVYYLTVIIVTSIYFFYTLIFYAYVRCYQYVCFKRYRSPCNTNIADQTTLGKYYK